MDKPTYCTDSHDTEELLAAVEESLLTGTIAAEIADTFSALADPVRVRIIGLMAETEMCVGDLCLVLEMTQPAISHHLRILRNMRIVSTRKAGRHVFYTLNDQHIHDIFTLSREHILHN
jgi:DNA-binding transcriptional ArsR family regulator